METVRVIYHHEADGWWAESPDVEGWSAAGNSYAEVVKLAEEGIPFALERETNLEHFVPAGEQTSRLALSAARRPLTLRSADIGTGLPKTAMGPSLGLTITNSPSKHDPSFV
ncbi:MAG TPA: type II toxin-antitoxin system HicB family antitoxin [Propionibacteriaceae bacterium]|nr:type II toxin-antitoxin system HicB family antitoxin [Propionibacteriaceae bacterium]